MCSEEQLPQLIVIDQAPNSHTVFVLSGNSWTIGRSEESTVRILRDGVSRQHALISREADSFYLTDQHSSWGTYLNGARIQAQLAVRLTNGALIGLGTTTPQLRFVDPDPTRPPNVQIPTSPSALEHDPGRQQFTLYGRQLVLPSLHYQLLAYLFRNQNQICRASGCIQAVWELHEQSADELTGRLYRLVSELRLTLAQQQTDRDDECRVRIESYRRRGYMLVLPAEPTARV